MESNRNHVSIEITPAYEALVYSIKEKMETITSANCICRVSDRHCIDFTKSYIPDKISIGPLHHGKEALKPMEDHKWRYLYSLLNRKPNLESSLNTCVQALKELEHKARLCYKEQIDLSSDDFVKLMLLDGGFIIELFFKYGLKGLKPRNDPIFTTLGLLFELRNNILLLENQIPFFILQRLFHIVPIPKQCNNNQSLIDLAYRFFRNMVPDDLKLHRGKFSTQECNHLLDLFRHCFLPTIPRVQVNQNVARKGLEPATKVREKGVKFKKAKTENLLDIKFVNGVLQIPPMKIHQYTESLFRNLIAFEQCCTCENYTKHIISYVTLMSSLICSNKDVKLLKSLDILVIDDDEKDILGLFERLRETINVNEDLKVFYFDGFCEEVKEFNKPSWGIWRKAKNQIIKITRLLLCL